MSIDQEVADNRRPDQEPGTSIELAAELTTIQAVGRLETDIAIMESEVIPGTEANLSRYNDAHGITPAGTRSINNTIRSPEDAISERLEENPNLGVHMGYMQQVRAYDRLIDMQDLKDNQQLSANVCRLVVADLKSGVSYDELHAHYLAEYEQADTEESEIINTDPEADTFLWFGYHEQTSLFAST